MSGVGFDSMIGAGSEGGVLAVGSGFGDIGGVVGAAGLGESPGFLVVGAGALEAVLGVDRFVSVGGVGG